MNFEQRDPIPIHMVSLFAGVTEELKSKFNLKSYYRL